MEHRTGRKTANAHHVRRDVARHPEQSESSNGLGLFGSLAGRSGLDWWAVAAADGVNVTEGHPAVISLRAPLGL
jgi:hypothetical protein